MMYNSTTVHSLPVILNIISNTLARMASLTNLTISTFSQPWPNLNPSELAAAGTAFMGGLFIGMAAALIPAGFGVAAVKDRVVSINYGYYMKIFCVQQIFLRYRCRYS